MGGDHAPAAIVAGAVLAAREHGVAVTLVGRREVVEEHVADAGGAGTVDVVDAPDVVEMGEDPVAALRARPGCSVRVACQLIADGVAGSIVSAGSTGATLTAALLTLGRLPGIRRPVVAAVVPLPGDRRFVLLDAGGTADAQPEVFRGFALMGTAYAEVLGVDQPTVGLLNIGTEPGKGNAVAKDAFALLDGTPGFTGNVEPADVLAGTVDVVVTDGFTGNVFLKTIEALAPVDESTADAAALVLGVGGEVFVAHGSAGAEQVARAVARASTVGKAGLASLVGQRLADKETG
jgi:glycerol-3-phosphate acyltransferase PlsX